ncbi:MAG TPA: hypothetical protein V6C88_09855 [Chroococcidiopsis sp.]
MDSKKIEQLLELIHLLPQEERILLAARLRQHEHTHSQHPVATPHPEGATTTEPNLSAPSESPTTLETPSEQPPSAPGDAVDEADDENSGLWAERDEPNSQSRKERILRQDKWLS